MDYEKAYKEALERATTLFKNANGMILKKWLEQVFPELKESEDEKIRKALIEWVKEFPDSIWRGHYTKDVKDVIAWLEKQGQQKPIIDGNLTATNYDKMFQNCNVPKFHEGDWIIYRDEGCTEILRIIGVTGTHYLCNDISDDYCRNLSINFIDNHNYHLWTIQDAKESDVLALEDKNFTTPFVAIYKSLGDTVYKELRDNLTFNSHCFIGFDGNFYEGEDGHAIEGVHPATKEQRELLFQKMKEAGYEWDDEKKESKMVKKQSKDKEINNFDIFPGLYKCVHRMFDGTPDGKLLFEVGNIYKCLSKHDRAEFEISYGHSVYLEDPVVCKHFIPLENQGEQKWSDEDDRIHYSLLADIKARQKSSTNTLEAYYNEQIDWLKSLKKRMEE